MGDALARDGQGARVVARRHADAAPHLTGYVLTALAIPLGLLDWRFAELFFLAAIVYGALLSVAAIALEALSFRRYPKATDLLRLVAHGVLENFGYRQLATWWRIVGVVDYFRGKRDGER